MLYVHPAHWREESCPGKPDHKIYRTFFYQPTFIKIQKKNHKLCTKNEFFKGVFIMSRKEVCLSNRTRSKVSRLKCGHGLDLFEFMRLISQHPT